MKNTFHFLAVCLLLGQGSLTLADKGDKFISAAPIIDAFKSEGPAFGGAAGMMLGINEATDFFLEADLTTHTNEADEANFETRALLGSLYTPYFGEIRPRFGGSGGVIHMKGPGDIDEVYFNLGFHLQGLYDISDAIRLFAEAHPNLTFGKHGEFSTLMKVGVQFRVSK